MDTLETAHRRAGEAIALIARREGIPEDLVRAELISAMGYSEGCDSACARFLRAGLGDAPEEASPEDLIAFIAVNFF